MVHRLKTAVTALAAPSIHQHLTGIIQNLQTELSRVISFKRKKIAFPMRSLEKAGPDQIWWSVALGYTTSPIMLKQYSPPEIL